MATTVDERIVAAKFDASDFEKGVNKTIKKLDELKKSLNLSEATESIKELSDKTEKSSESLGQSLEKLTNRFTTFTGMIKQTIIGGLANEVASVFLRMEQTVTGFIRSISSDQVGAGMSKYTEILNSVRTMTAAGKDEDLSYDAIKRLGEYSDQTSYSLNQMTSAMSKFIAAGVEKLDDVSSIETAERMVEGLANMAASAGVNIYDAQRAFVNFAQAYSQGTMKLYDWTSFESLNMATEKVMQVFMEAGERAGTLTATLDKDGNKIYKTTNKINKAVQAGKTVGTQGFRGTLAYGWLDKKTMRDATAVLSYYEELGADLSKLSDEDLKNFNVQAFQAAKEARSFADVIGTVKDVVATGWATTFEGLFGRLSEATAFFTELSDGALANAIYRISEWRNALVDVWNSEDLNGEGAGGKAFRDSVINITEALGTMIQTFEQLFGIVDPEDKKGGAMIQSLGEKIKIATWRFQEFTINLRDTAESFNTWMNSSMFEGGPTRMEILQGVLGKLASALGIVGTVFKEIWKAAQENEGNLYSMVDSFVMLADNVGKILDVMEPLAGVLGKVIGFLGEVGSFFLGLSIDAATFSLGYFADILGLILELFGQNSSQLENGEGVLDKIRKDFEGIKEACSSGLSAVKDFLGSLFDDVKKLLGIGVDGSEGGFFENVANFFKTNEFVQNVKNWFAKAIQDVQNFIKKIPGKLKKLPSLISQFIHGLFYKKTQRYNGSMLEETEVPTLLKEWLDNAIEDVQEFIASIPGFVASIPSLIVEFIHSLFYTKTMRYNGSMLEETEVPNALNEWLTKAKDDAITFITSLPSTISGWINNVGTVLGTFVDQMIWVYKEDKNGVKEKTDVKTKFGEWLDQAKNDALNFITTDLPNGIAELPSVLARFVDGLLWDEKTTDNRSFFSFNKSKSTKIPTKLNEWLTQATKDAWDFISKDLPKGLSEIPSVLISFIDGLLWEEKSADDRSFFNFNKSTKVPTKLNAWLSQASKDAWAFISGDLPAGIMNALKNGAGVLQRFVDGLLWEEKTADDRGFFNFNRSTKVPTKLNAWLTQASKEAWDFISKDLPKGLAEIPSVLISFIDGLLWEEKSADSRSFFNFNKSTKVPTKLNAWLSQASKDAWAFISEDLPAGIMNALKNGAGIFQQFIDGLLWEEESADDRGFFSFNKSTKVPTKLNAWLTQASKDAWAFISEDLPSGIMDALKNGVGILQRFIDGLLYEEKTADDRSFFSFNKSTKVPTKLNAWLTQASKDAWKFISEDLPSGITDALKNGVGILQQFIHGLLWNAETDEQGNETGGEVPSALNIWLENAVDDTTAFIKSIPDRIREVPSIVSTFIDELVKSPEQRAIEEKQRKITESYTDAFGNIINPDEYEKALKAAEENIEKKAEGFNLWDSVLQIGGSLKDAFIDLAPDILDGINGAFIWLSDKMAYVTNWLTENHQNNETITDAITRAIEDDNTPEEEKGLFTAIRNIGQTIFDFITVTIPGFISAAIDEVKLQVPKLLSGLWSGVDGIVDDVTKSVGDLFDPKSDQKTRINTRRKSLFEFGSDVESVKTAIEEYKKKVDELSKAEDKETITREEALRRLNTEYRILSGEISREESMYSEKYKDWDWTSKESLAKRDAEKQKITKQIKDLEKITDTYVIASKDGTFSRFTEYTEQDKDAGKSAGEGLGAFASGFVDALSAISASDTLKTVAVCIALAYVMSTIRDILSVTDEFETIGWNAKMLAIQTAVTGIVALVGWITYLASDTSEVGQERLSSVEDAFARIASFAKTISDLIVAIVTALTIKSGVELGADLFSSFGSGGLIKELLGKLADLGLIAVGSEAIGKSFESLFGSLSDMLVDIGSGINGFMTFLGPAVTEMADISEPLETAIGVVENIAVLIGKFYDVIGIVGISVAEGNESEKNLMYLAQIMGSDQPVSAAFLAKQLENRMSFMFELSTVMEKFSNSIATFEGISDPTGQMKRMLDTISDEDGTFKKFIEKISDIVYDNVYYMNKEEYGDSLHDFSIGFELLTNALSIFGTSLTDLSPENVDALDKTLDVFNKLAEVFKGVTGKQSVIDSLISGDKTISTFGSEIATFGVHMKTFYDQVKGVSSEIGDEDINIALKFTQIAENIASAINLRGSTNISSTWWGTYKEIFTDFFSNLSDKDNLNLMVTAAKALSESIENAFNNDETGELQPHIVLRPVITFDQEYLSQQLANGMALDGGTFNLDMNALVAAVANANSTTEQTVHDYTTQLDTINSSIQSISTNTATASDLASAFASMGIVLDTGALAGGIYNEIDDLIGQKVIMIIRGNSV